MLENGQLRLTVGASAQVPVAAIVAWVLDRIHGYGSRAVELTLDMAGPGSRCLALLPRNTSPFLASRLAEDIAVLPGIDAVALQGAQRRNRAGDGEALIDWRELGRWCATLPEAKAA